MSQNYREKFFSFFFLLPLFVMANSLLKLPTTITDFISFLDGESVEPYGDQGTTLIDTLRTTFQAAIYEVLNNYQKVSIDNFQYVVQANFFGRLQPAPFSRSSSVIFSSCYSWVINFMVAPDAPILISKPHVLIWVKAF